MYQRLLPSVPGRPQVELRTALRAGLVAASAAVLLSACGLISPQSVYEGVRSNEKAKAVVTDKSRSELPPYDQYQKERTGADR